METRKTNLSLVPEPLIAPFGPDLAQRVWDLAQSLARVSAEQVDPDHARDLQQDNENNPPDEPYPDYCQGSDRRGGYVESD